jgi:hypothetical protein
MVARYADAHLEAPRRRLSPESPDRRVDRQCWFSHRLDNGYMRGPKPMGFMYEGSAGIG